MADDIMYFEDFVMDGEKVLSMGRTITEFDAMQFACLTGEQRPVYCDAEYAKQYSPLGERLVNPMLPMDYTNGVLLDNGLTNAKIGKSILAFLGITEWNFIKHAKIGDTIHSESEVVGLRDNRPDRGIVSTKVQVVNQNGEILQEGYTAAYIAKRCFFENKE